MARPRKLKNQAQRGRPLKKRGRPPKNVKASPVSLKKRGRKAKNIKNTKAVAQNAHSLEAAFLNSRQGVLKQYDKEATVQAKHLVKLEKAFNKALTQQQKAEKKLDTAMQRSQVKASPTTKRVQRKANSAYQIAAKTVQNLQQKLTILRDEVKRIKDSSKKFAQLSKEIDKFQKEWTSQSKIALPAGNARQASNQASKGKRGRPKKQNLNTTASPAVANDSNASTEAEVINE